MKTHQPGDSFAKWSKQYLQVNFAFMRAFSKESLMGYWIVDVENERPTARFAVRKNLQLHNPIERLLRELTPQVLGTERNYLLTQAARLSIRRKPHPAHRLTMQQLIAAA